MIRPSLSLSRVPMRRTFATAETAAHSMQQWKKASIYIGLPLCVLLSVVNAGILATSGHAHNPGDDRSTPLPSYMRIRNKPFPWECDDCALFDGHCWEECRNKKKGKE